MTDRTKYIIYIDNNINKLKIDYRQELLLYLIMNSGIDNDKMLEKGMGTQIPYNLLNNKILEYIYNFIQNKLKNDFLFE